MKRIDNFNEINNALIKIKNYKKKLITNFYPNREKNDIWISKGNFYIIDKGEVVYFINKKARHCTLFFIASSNEELSKSLPNLIVEFQDEILILDIVQREETSELLDIFYNHSFYYYTSLVRMNRLSGGKDFLLDQPEGIKEASSSHLVSIQNLFNTFFDEKAEQLPERDELIRWIENKNILVYEENNALGGFLIYEIIGNTLYLRYWFVHPDFREKKIGSKLFNFFESKGKDTNRHIFWVIKSNENAIKRYKHYGFVEEKMYNFILSNKMISYE
ncbi:GNAT family N-acetyltransferase [Flavobacterium sp. LHD-85]|uniref:GNAT family N-acetyltransferase n=1 Tax=Flavobacterium sp. LHD-85 TaxID=3071410 RepID=UPI0027E0A381|nr:GNAT family N-acetyltransferase [Flavobacterium sp. LHD-85]MDQ6529589.1 GNAT family N-acetyltransferase [Flavobacterium sp. LHD-85]